jgi:hypothetical protein
MFSRDSFLFVVAIILVHISIIVEKTHNRLLRKEHSDKHALMNKKRIKNIE